MKKILAFFISVFILNCLFAEKIVISVPFISQSRIQEYIEAGYDIAQVFPHRNEVHIVVNEEQKEFFQEKYPDVNVVFTETQMRENLVSRERNLPGYHSYTEIVERMMELEEQNPNLCQLIELGPSQGKLYYDAGNNNYADYNHIIYAMKLSDNPDIFQDKPNYLFFGNIHAREPLPSEVCLALIEDLISTYSPTNPEHPLNCSQIWIVPILNPDGRQIVYSQLEIWHRKTIFDNNNNGVLDYDNVYGYGASIDGIDANRNFGYKWGTSGVNFNMMASTYPGLFHFQSVEISYIRDLAATISFVAGFDYHSYGNQVLIPYGYASGVSSHNYEVVTSLGNELAGLMPSYILDPVFEAIPSWDLYPCSGASDDYLHYTHNTLMYGVEIAGNFIPPTAAVEFYKENQLPAAYHLMARHKTRFLTGLVTDIITLEPVQAEIKIFPIDTYNPERAPIYSNSEFGRYHYPLRVGVYQLYVRADNYHPHYEYVTITATGQTLVNIELVPALQFDKTFIFSHINQEDLFTEAKIILSHTRIDTLYTDVNGSVKGVNISPGQMTIIAKGTDLKTYITELFLTDIEITNRNPINIQFDDFIFADEFTTFAGNWTTNGWQISTLDAYSGNSSARLANFMNNGTLTTSSPIQIPAGVKTYVNFMARYDSGVHATSFIEFSFSQNGQTWQPISQLRDIDTWTNLYYIIPENTYNQLYFRFRANYIPNDWDTYPQLPFYLDLFCVNIDSEVPENDLPLHEIPSPSVTVYPNPFNPETTISLDLPIDSFANINIYNIRGQKVKEIENDFLAKGKHEFIWNGTDEMNKGVSSGVYFYQIKTDTHTSHGKMMLVK